MELRGDRVGPRLPAEEDIERVIDPPSNSLSLGSLEQLEQRVRRSRLQRHLEQDLACRRCEASPAVLVDEHADLLVAWARVVQMACQSRDAAVDLGDRQRVVVQPLDRGEQRRADARSGYRHPSSVAEHQSRDCRQTAPIPPSNSLWEVSL